MNDASESPIAAMPSAAPCIGSIGSFGVRHRSSACRDVRDARLVERHLRVLCCTPRVCSDDLANALVGLRRIDGEDLCRVAGDVRGALRELRPFPRKSIRTFMDSPMRSGCSASCSGRNLIRTGTRCTTLIQLPLAFWAGKSANAAPVPMPTPATRLHSRRACRRRRR